MNAYEYPVLQGQIAQLQEVNRQQADRIAELEKLVSEMKYEKSSGVFEKQSEPVAWISIDVEQGKTIGFEKKQWAEIHIPLYTTPQTKPLSDEEVHELANKHLRTQDHDGAKVVLGLEDFARAIEAKVRGEK